MLDRISHIIVSGFLFSYICVASLLVVLPNVQVKKESSRRYDNLRDGNRSPKLS